MDGSTGVVHGPGVHVLYTSDSAVRNSTFTPVILDLDFSDVHLFGT